ncbi:MAG TPA: BTAD domain-containing putative transcriptional regulator [Anaerolineales bacterium]|nr:BTAD domain-containing putative transcriptional regulator [Anaerolineales bacterium]
MVADREAIGWNSDADTWLDVSDFESRIGEGRRQSDPASRAALLADSTRLYRNHFLTGFSLKDAHPFNDWAFAKSEELRHQLARALFMLSEDYCALGQAEQAIPYARRLITLDPLNEGSHRQLMQVYIQAGQHSAALKQYQACEQLLRKELGVDPQPETRELYKKIRKRDLKPTQGLPSATKASESTLPLHNLPLQLSSFIGREKEQKTIAKLIASNRLVTLVGTGGIGKTSLALYVGHKLLHEYPDGIWFVALDALSDPALVPQTVAAVFDIRERSDKPILELLTHALSTKTALLILDNSEHLLDACAQLVTALLQTCPGLKILATSREPLAMAGEATYRIPSLSLPERRQDSLEKLSEYEAVRMFAERAGLVQSAFELTKENMQAVAAICRKVDGIPLAIELAAARVNILQVDEILHQLEESFHLLANQSRTTSSRHQTLQASMDWSWRLLEESERVFLRQLSIFAGGWTLDAAQAVCDGNVLELTSALVKKSLIVVQQTRHGTRYRFHEIVRQYASQKLTESGDQNRLHTWHLGYFLRLAEQAELELRGSSLVDWMARLNEERNNIRIALHWADQIDVEAGLYLSSRLMRYWESANLPEGRRWLENFIHKPESKDFPLARAHALHTYSWLLTWLQQFQAAYPVAEESLALFRAAGDRQGEVDVLVSLENMFQFKEDLATALEIGKQAVALAQSLGDRWRLANAFLYLGWNYHDLPQRFVYWEKAIGLYREVGDQLTLANLLGLLGQFRVLHGDFELGEQYVEEALRLWEANRRASVWDSPRITQSLIASMKGDYEQAETILREVMIYAQERGNWMSQLWVQLRLGHVLLRAGNLTEARQLLTETAQNFGRDDYTIGAVFALEGLAELFSVVGKPEQAARLIGCADLIREMIQDSRPEFEQANVDKIMVACLAKIGEVAFSDAYEEGQRMTLEEAVAFVVGDATLSSPVTIAQSRSSQMPVLQPKRPRKKSSKRTLTQGP